MSKVGLQEDIDGVDGTISWNLPRYLDGLVDGKSCNLRREEYK